MTPLRQWIKDHDDRLSFVVLYIGGAIALSIVFNLFWVIMLMLAHFVLEIVRGTLLEARRPLAHALWEVKLDIALVLFALVVALYAEHVLALLGLGQAARAGQAARGIQFAARFAVVKRALSIFLLTIDDLARLAQAATRFWKQRSGPPPAATVPVAPAAASGPAYATGDVVSLAFGALCVLMILLTPALTATPASEVAAHLLHEISPYR